MILESSGAVAGGESQYRVKRSLRLRASASAYLSRTLTIAGNRQKHTIAFSAKRGVLASTTVFAAAAVDNNNRDSHSFNASEGITLYSVTGGTGVMSLSTAAVFRDPSAWYNIIIKIDTTQATDTERAVLYVNDVRVALTGTWPTQNALLWINNTIAQYIGTNMVSPTPAYADLLIADYHFIDGQALDPSSFGLRDATTGEWSPMRYEGAYGTNGFHLDFADNSAATAVAIGADRSGNGNNWTPNNISVTAGATNDSLVDVPTNYGGDTGLGGEVRGNYAVWNSLAPRTMTNIIDAGVTVVGITGATGGETVGANFAISKGRWYWEVTPTVSTPDFGFNAGFGTSYDAASTDYCLYTSDGMVTAGAGAASSTGHTTYTTNDVIGIAVDADAQTFQFFKNGVLAASGTYSAPVVYPVVRVIRNTNGQSYTLNSGQRPFGYTAPSGYKALCTQNLPDPVIRKPSKYFDINLRAGTSGATSITGKEFQPDLIWAKSRSGIRDHVLFDSVRGVTKGLFPNLNYAEVTSTTTLTSFNADGFSLGATQGSMNYSGESFVDWFWKMGAIPGLDIQPFTAGVGGTYTVNHNLGILPSMIIEKVTSTTSGWSTWHKSMDASPNNYYVSLNLTSAKTNLSNWMVPSTTTVSRSGRTSGDIGICFIWAEVPGFSKFGVYIGNGSSNGPFVHCGFKPKFVMCKRIDSTGNWNIYDANRTGYNGLNGVLWANLSNAESSPDDITDLLSNGFKLRNNNIDRNASGGTYIYMAFAETPFKYARAR